MSLPRRNTASNAEGIAHEGLYVLSNEEHLFVTRYLEPRLTSFNTSVNNVIHERFETHNSEAEEKVDRVINERIDARNSEASEKIDDLIKTHIISAKEEILNHIRSEFNMKFNAAVSISTFESELRSKVDEGLNRKQTRMDSEEFQKQIDEALRKDEEIGKGKGVEGAGEEANDGREGKESERETEGQAREEELDNNLAPTVEENVPKQITTRQSKRKTAPPPPFPPPRPSTSKAIGTIRIKKTKLAEETIVNKPKQITKPPTNKPAPVKPAPRTQSRPIQQQPAEQNLLETNQQIDSSEEEDDEENQGTNGGGMWSGAYQTKNRQQRMTVGGITLGDADER
ncbi:uncharacterized protein MELLADRAFT_110341 [Melampsora larici-populina 98AG31]|uniref:Uncharacterized protein n=1 Tax=Melampsora larici-populina (strain 98AG31 / pathotype 3-4-7) TaxID=747676 RepID=F4RZG0_MELLP|nr:uncharacterized protein MELLADRAFT_110341 [Melampsora larici-populina 98AG31]EGG02261.1 hypothetical protein MELLADRAFT_110341 [Melampsora larici-populina 98AG31]